jgi:hypothetical protein
LAAAIGRHYADAIAGAPALATQVAPGLDRMAAAALAATWLERAGDGAFSIGARAGAADFFRRSIDLTTPGARLDLARRWRRFGESVVGTLDLEDAAGAFVTASDLAEAVMDDPASSDGETVIARREVAVSAASLSRARYEQIRFAEALQVAEAALAIVGEDEPEAIRLRLARLRGIEGVFNDYERVFRESGPLLEAARATGDAELEFDVRLAHLSFSTSYGATAADAWTAVAGEARKLRRWPEMVRALINAAAMIQQTERDEVALLLDEAEAVAEARGLNEQLAWIGLFRSTTAFVAGDWDVASSAARQAIATAERYGYDRAAVRTWFALTPIAEARGDLPTLAHAAVWFEAHGASFPDSPYGRLQRVAVELRLAAAGFGPPPDLGDKRLLAGFALDDDSAEWLAAVERIVADAVLAGRSDLARTWIDLLPAAGRDDAGALVRVSRALCRGTVAVAVDDGGVSAVAEAREALSEARAAAAPWWIARSIRLLELLSAASAAELDEAINAERRLGIPEEAGRPGPKWPGVAETAAARLPGGRR